ncbi:hypothetical protein BMS3Bbin03_02584 [bacterium BMS3Bbin03]|nr:hypothetical protein BMS3Bbin03_02584 [bacterium BMS3Bbin03]
MKRVTCILLSLVIFMTSVLVMSAAAQEKLYRKGRYYIGEITQAYPVKDGGLLKILRMKGDISVKSWDKPLVEIHQKIKMDVFTRSEAEKGFESAKASTQANGKTIFVDGGSYRSWMHVDFQVNVPRAFNTKLQTRGGDLKLIGIKGDQQVSTSGGDIKLADLSGAIQARTSGGDISAKRVKGTLSVATSGGDLNLTDIAGILSGSTSGGDVTVKNCTDRVNVSTSGGDIDIVNARDDLNARTSGGDIQIREAGGRVSIATSGGDISVLKAGGDVNARTSGGDIEITDALKNVLALTSGGDITIENVAEAAVAKTSGGGIIIKNAGGSVEAKTSGGDVAVQMNPTDFAKDHHASIASSGGDLELVLPGKLPATIHALIEVKHKPLSDYSITSDFPLSIQKKEKSGWKKIIEASGDINGGGDKIELKTVNGNITIKKE